MIKGKLKEEYSKLTDDDLTLPSREEQLLVPTASWSKSKQSQRMMIDRF